VATAARLRACWGATFSSVGVKTSSYLRFFPFDSSTTIYAGFVGARCLVASWPTTATCGASSEG